MPLSASVRARLRRALLSWYRRERRDLPWRRTRDPWAIWVSEVMLQQTRVETVVPYYLEFLARFPTLAALARARESSALEAWSGLGYYRRVRQLRDAATTVVRDHGGVVPRDPDAFGSLSGVGPYTRAAVLSMGFGTPLAVLDGNVARVLSRVFMRSISLRTPAGARELLEAAQALLPSRDAGDWNQAMMELGAMVCLPRSPRCERCPIAAQCQARAAGRVDEFPPANARPEIVRLRRAVAWVERGSRVLVVERRGAILDRMWEPPGIDLAAAEAPRKKLAAMLRELGVSSRLRASGRVERHAITNRAIEVEVWLGTPRARMAEEPAGALVRARFVTRARPGVPLTALARRLFAAPPSTMAITGTRLPDRPAPARATATTRAAGVPPAHRPSSSARGRSRAQHS